SWILLVFAKRSDLGGRGGRTSPVGRGGRVDARTEPALGDNPPSPLCTGLPVVRGKTAGDARTADCGSFCAGRIRGRAPPPSHGALCRGNAGGARFAVAHRGTAGSG